MAGKRRKPVKPTGRTGPVKVTTGPNEASVEFQQVDFPRSKEEVETFVARGFVAAATRKGLFSARVQDVELNPLDDWDITVTVDGEEKWLELMELAPLEEVGGSHERAPASYNSYDFSKNAFTKLLGKSERYVKPSGKELWLLLYVTAWQFILSDTAIALLQYSTCHSTHVFDRIYSFKPTSEDDGIVWHIYPTPTEYWTKQGFDPERYRDSVVQNFDPGSLKSGPR